MLDCMDKLFSIKLGDCKDVDEYDMKWRMLFNQFAQINLSGTPIEISETLKTALFHDLGESWSS